MYNIQNVQYLCLLPYMQLFSLAAEPQLFSLAMKPYLFNLAAEPWLLGFCSDLWSHKKNKNTKPTLPLLFNSTLVKWSLIYMPVKSKCGFHYLTCLKIHRKYTLAMANWTFVYLNNILHVEYLTFLKGNIPKISSIQFQLN